MVYNALHVKPTRLIGLIIEVNPEGLDLKRTPYVNEDAFFLQMGKLL